MRVFLDHSFYFAETTSIHGSARNDAILRRSPHSPMACYQAIANDMAVVDIYHWLAPCPRAYEIIEQAHRLHLHHQLQMATYPKTASLEAECFIVASAPCRHWFELRGLTLHMELAVSHWDARSSGQAEKRRIVL